MVEGMGLPLETRGLLGKCKTLGFLNHIESLQESKELEEAVCQCLYKCL